MSIQSVEGIASTLTRNVDRPSGNSEVTKKHSSPLPGNVDKEERELSHDKQQVVLEDAVKEINDSLLEKDSDVVLSVHEESGKNVVLLVELSTKEVLRQFPPEEVIGTAMKLEDVRGMLFEEKV